MKGYFYKVLILILLGFFPLTVKAQMPVADNISQKGMILIISSYNPDAERVRFFFNAFEKCVKADGEHYDVFLETLACKSIVDSPRWITDFTETINKYKTSSLKAIILLGQEAWATYVALPDLRINVPVFVCYASVNGVDISTYRADTLWAPKSIDMTAAVDFQADLGGLLCKYNVAQNIELALKFSPIFKIL